MISIIFLNGTFFINQSVINSPTPFIPSYRLLHFVRFFLPQSNIEPVILHSRYLTNRDDFKQSEYTVEMTNAS